jgi:hypothetical protein
MLRYLLADDDLSALEVERIEEDYFCDDETFETLLTTEDELIDRYLRGELDARQREKFERRFLLSPRRRQKLENARAMRSVISEIVATKTASPELLKPETARPRPNKVESKWNLRSPIYWLAGLKLSPSVSLAMATLLAVIGGAGLFKIIRSNRALDRAREAQATLASQAASARLEKDLLAQRLQQANDQIANLTKGQHGSSIASNSIPRFSLNLDTSDRSGGEPVRLIIPSKADVAQLQVLMPPANYLSYRAALQTPGGDEIWTQRRLQARQTASGEMVITLWLPAALLAPGDYLLELRGVTASRQIERLQPCAFSVERK